VEIVVRQQMEIVGIDSREVVKIIGVAVVFDL
jgi:hypothetical protein